MPNKAIRHRRRDFLAPSRRNRLRRSALRGHGLGSLRGPQDQHIRGPDYGFTTLAALLADFRADVRRLAGGGYG